ncbi:MAG TPA: hypothetical protein DCW90_14590 [Lachnospiraceae bacterium]|nr:BtrH N-terminal domain-containing protein [uncultured Lachnoclostridium sp.]HAU86662.1 hypothetical protein [Lachnospiraceae bacterium]
MMRVVKNILDYQTMGSNCSTTVSKIIFNYYGYPFSEDMVFGLGAGLGFIYQYYVEDNSCFLSGKNESIELNLAYAVGGTVVTGSFDDEDLAWETVKGYIDKDMPVILDLSIRYLPYFKPYLAEVKNIGFGLHNAILAGYDDELEQVMLLDHRWDAPQIISYQELRQARAAKESGVNSRNTYKVYLLPECTTKKPDIELMHAIRLNIQRMKYPFAFKMGIDGIKMFRKEILKMLQGDMDNEKQDIILTYSYLMERLGTGGGNFRRIYGRFLSEAGKMTGIEKFQEVSKLYTSLARTWKKTSNLLAKSVEDSSCIAELDETLNVIIEREIQGMNLLEDILEEVK